MKRPYPPSPHRNTVGIAPAIIVFLLPIGAHGGTYSPKTGSAPNTTEVSESELALLPAKGPYFICDDRVTEDRWKIERFVVPLKRHSDNPLLVTDYPWEGSGPSAACALYDPKDKMFKMWYSVFSKNAYENGLPYSYNACYAESRDGLKWQKPFLGLFDVSVHGF